MRIRIFLSSLKIRPAPLVQLILSKVFDPFRFQYFKMIFPSSWSLSLTSILVTILNSDGCVADENAVAQFAAGGVLAGAFRLKDPHCLNSASPISSASSISILGALSSFLTSIFVFRV